MNNFKTPKSAKKRAGPSRRRRKVRRAADPAVQHRAAGHVSKPAADPEVSSEEGEYSEYISSPEKDRASATSNPNLQISPEKVVVREEVEEVSEAAVEAEAEKPPRPRVAMPVHYVNWANIENWVEKYWDANTKMVEEAKRLMAATDKCCFCEFNCPPPSQQEDENRFDGVQDSLWDHIEMYHPLEWEWLG